MIDDFGIIIACCDQDYFLVKGCCASIRYFLGDIPICLIVDGDLSVKSLQNHYGVHVINQQTVKQDILRKRSFGWGITKMVSFWESPWERFLFVDADTIVWGNILKYVNFDDFDMIVDKPLEINSDAAIEKYFFHVSNLEKHFPDFDWQKHRADYFCTGTFFAKRNTFSLQEYINMLDFVEANPDVFSFGGEMSFLNLMIFRAGDRGKIRVGQENMQVIAPDWDIQDLKKRFCITENGPRVQNQDGFVIHWAGPKPLLSTQKTYADPMTFFRRQFAAIDRGYSGKKADFWLSLEDYYSTTIKYKNKMRKKLKNLVSSF
ncbi:hypothetical protein [Roseofilum capinflatum]|uniref:Glycosyl transferase n=1 Tax=Roseofilum capinflatum BLCC-M114 TaxID=3022440 RepID=A0ABT7B8J1_9CYAN|nr:hypothetical protein [Roseofilum capinflatum]MDJ1175498.1 hypothetical protein [Roseofilum capinflatum BLCC-M114]